MTPPEDLPELLEPLRGRFLDSAEAGMRSARTISIVFLLVLVWAVVAALQRQVAPQDSVVVGFAALLLTVMGLLPWWDSRRERREARALSPGMLKAEAQEARFGYWIDRQKAPATVCLLVLMIVVAAGQVQVGLPASLQAGGLIKEGGYHAGEWWRLFTAPFLHGNALHLFLNMMALWYLGRRTEALSRWPHLPAVFLASMLAGGFATATFVPTVPSLGGSGGVLGLLGFLVAFELLHPALVPRPVRRRLAAGIGMAFLIGFLGYRFIDNAAHAGGLLAGACYALVAFPRSRSARRPVVLWIDRIVGGLSLAVLSASSLFTVWRLIGS
jgi:membrane associated rhomboid family serine protease